MHSALLGPWKVGGARDEEEAREASKEKKKGKHTSDITRWFSQCGHQTTSSSIPESLLEMQSLRSCQGPTQKLSAGLSNLWFHKSGCESDGCDSLRITDPGK